MSVVWLDGTFHPEEKAMVRATDRGFLHGRGLFETMRAYGGVPFRLADHIARMAASADRFKIPIKAYVLEPVIRELCLRNQCEDASVRITLSADGHLLITARKRKPVPEAWYEKGAEVMVAPWRRDPRAPLVGHKTLNYWEGILTHEEAAERGCADALYVGIKGELLEGCYTNVFLVIKGKVVTPSLAGVLPGVTRQVVMEIVPVKERRVRLKELWKASEAFLTNSLVEILPITRPGPVTRRIMEEYRALTRTVLSPTKRRFPSVK